MSDYSYFTFQKSMLLTHNKNLRAEDKNVNFCGKEKKEYGKTKQKEPDFGTKKLQRYRF